MKPGHRIAAAFGGLSLLAWSTGTLLAHPVLDKCPTNPPPGRSWRSYFNDLKTGSWAYVIFDNNPKVPADRPWNGACVAFVVHPPWGTPGGKSHSISVHGYFNNWHSKYTLNAGSGLPNTRWRPGNKSGYEPVSVNLPMPDLSKFQIAVWDEIFIYNEAGEIHHAKYRKVGRLVCSPPPPDSPCLKGKVPIGRFFSPF